VVGFVVEVRRCLRGAASDRLVRSIVVAVITLHSAVVVRVAALDRLYPGGVAAFAIAHSDGSFCCDGELVAVSAPSPRDAWALLSSLEEDGLVAFRDGEAGDLVCVDGRSGPAVHCPWLEFEPFLSASIAGAGACRLVGGSSSLLALPVAWQARAGVEALQLCVAGSAGPAADGETAAPVAVAGALAVAFEGPGSDKSIADAPTRRRRRTGIGPAPLGPSRPFTARRVEALLGALALDGSSQLRREIEVCCEIAGLLGGGGAVGVDLGLDRGLDLRLDGRLHPSARFQSQWSGVDLRGAARVVGYLHARVRQLAARGVAMRAEVVACPSPSGAWRAGVLCFSSVDGGEPEWAGTITIEWRDDLVATLRHDRTTRPRSCRRVAV
jgi:hypothetical protein